MQGERATRKVTTARFFRLFHTMPDEQHRAVRSGRHDALLRRASSIRTLGKYRSRDRARMGTVLAHPSGASRFLMASDSRLSWSRVVVARRRWEASMSAARSESTLGRSLVASLVAAVPLAFGSPAHAWQRVLAAGSGCCISHSGVAVVQSPEGTVFVGGRIQFEGHREFGLDSTNGTDLWSRNLRGGNGARTVPSPAT